MQEVIKKKRVKCWRTKPSTRFFKRIEFPVQLILKSVYSVLLYVLLYTKNVYFKIFIIEKNKPFLNLFEILLKYFRKGVNYICKNTNLKHLKNIENIKESYQETGIREIVKKNVSTKKRDTIS